jgi:hypothetical protein
MRVYRKLAVATFGADPNWGSFPNGQSSADIVVCGLIVCLKVGVGGKLHVHLYVKLPKSYIFEELYDI